MKNLNLIDELILTFSNKISLFSSKKLERCIVFLTLLLSTNIFIYKKLDVLSAGDLVLILGVWLGYAGYNTLMTRKDKQDENITEGN